MNKANKAKPTETKNLNQIIRKTQWIKKTAFQTKAK